MSTVAFAARFLVPRPERVDVVGVSAGFSIGSAGGFTVAIPATARSMLRRAGAKLSTTSVTASPIFMYSRALRGAGSAISRSGT
ncbi:MAG: hypothetical protein R2713_00475 [Ilumatobacteraceae bacterium]